MTRWAHSCSPINYMDFVISFVLSCSLPSVRVFFQSTKLMVCMCHLKGDVNKHHLLSQISSVDVSYRMGGDISPSLSTP